MKILLLTQTFYPETAPDIKGLPFAKKLQEKGHSVQVLTGFPNYPGGKLYDGYRIKFFQKEIINGVEVIRVPLYPSHDSSPVRRTLTYLSFAFSAALLGVFLIRKADVMHAYQPPATIAIPALWIKLIRRIPVVYDIQDLWPDTLQSTGMVNSRWVISLVGVYCRLIYKFINYFIVLSPGFKKILSKRGVDEHRIEVVYNWSNDITISGNGTPATELRKVLHENDFVVLYAGNIGKAQALDNVVQSAEILQEKDPRIKIAFIGGGVEVDNLKMLMVELQLKNVVFLDRVSFDKIGAIMQSADVLLIHLRKDPLFTITIPSKLQTYLRVGKPILMGAEGDAVDLLKNSGGGLTCEAENPDDIAEKIMQLSHMPCEERTKMGERAREYYSGHLDADIGVDKALQIFKKAANKK